MPTERDEAPERADLADLKARLTVEFVPNTGPFDPLEALAELAVSLWLAREGRGNVQAPESETAEERRAAG